MEYKIEKDVPIPGPRWALKYPWDRMEAGDSVVFPLDAEKTVRNSVSTWLSRHRPDLRYVGRRLDEGFRLWFVSRNGREG